MSPGPKDKYNAPSNPVAWPSARNVSAELPFSLQANAHLVASRTNFVNSARKNKVTCDMTFNIRIVRCGLFATSEVKIGCSRELLYAKKIVAVRHTVVMIAARTVIDRSRIRNSEAAPFEKDEKVLLFSRSYLSMALFGDRDIPQ